MTPLHNAHATLPPPALDKDGPQPLAFDRPIQAHEHASKQLPSSDGRQAIPRYRNPKVREQIFELACRTFDEAAVQSLLTANQDLITPQEYYEFVGYAAFNGKNGILDLLLRLKKGNTDEYRTLLDLATRRATVKGYIDIVRDLIEKGAPVRNHGESALHLAMMFSHREIGKLLVQAGADIEASDRYKSGADTPLLLSIQNGDDSCLQWLLEQGANPNGRPDNKGRYPLAVACLYGNLSKVKMLLDAGAHLDVGKKERATPLAVAVGQGHTEVGRYLIDIGADVNAACKPRHAPLYKAVAHGRLYDLAEALLKAGAEPDLLCGQEVEKTPLMIAVRNKNRIMAEFLVNHGADIHRKDRKGRSSLDLAKRLKSEHIVTMLQAKLIQQADQPGSERRQAQQ